MIAGQILMHADFYWGERSCFSAVGKSEIKKLSIGYFLSNGQLLTKDFFGEKIVVVSRFKTTLTTTRKRGLCPSDGSISGLKSCPLAYFFSTEGFF